MIILKWGQCTVGTGSFWYIVLILNYVLSFGGKGEAIERAKLSPKTVKNAAKTPISSSLKSCEIKIAKLLARAVKLEPDKLDMFIDNSPRDIILKNK